MLNIALIGLGIMGQNHLRELLRTEHRLYLYDVAMPQSVINLADDRCHLIDSIDELARYEIHGAIIAVPTKYHADVFARVSRLARAILLEKPVALSLQEAKSIKQNSRLNDVFVGFSERFSPSVRAFVRIAKDEQILSMDFMRASPYPSRISDVGVGLDLAVHDVDLARFLGFGGELVCAKYSHQSLTHEDEVTLHAKHKPLYIKASWCYHTKIRQAIINTTAHTYLLDMLAGDLYQDGVMIPTDKEHSSLYFEHKEFFDFILGRNQNPSLASLDDGIAALRPLLG